MSDEFIGRAAIGSQVLQLQCLVECAETES